MTFHGSVMGVSMKIKGALTEVSKCIRKMLKGVSVKFQMCLKKFQWWSMKVFWVLYGNFDGVNVLWVCQGRLKCVSSSLEFEKSFKGVSRMFQGSFKGVSRNIKGSSKSP